MEADGTSKDNVPEEEIKPQCGKIKSLVVDFFTTIL
jgi:hypothetical protein